MKLPRRVLAAFVGLFLALVFPATANAQLLFTNVGPGGFGLSPYEGLIATKAGLANTLTAGNRSLMCRSSHTATENITNLAIAISEIFSDGTTTSKERGTGAAQGLHVTASVEFPAGTFTAITFDGASQATGYTFGAAVPTAGTTSIVGVKWSDHTTISIPLGSNFWIREWEDTGSTAGVTYLSARDVANGDLMTVTSGIATDQTMGGTVTQTVGGTSCRPLAIRGSATHASVAGLGDSRMYGVQLTPAADYRIGNVFASFPSVTPIAFVNLATASSLAQTYASESPGRSLIWPYVSHVVSELCINDIAIINSRTAAQCEGDLQALWALLPVGTQITQTTLEPVSTSTDGWLTTVNQTPTGNTPHITQFRTDIMAGISGQNNGFYDIGSVVSANGCKLAATNCWVALPAPPYTADGLHFNTAGSALTVSSGVVNTANIHRP